MATLIQDTSPTLAEAAEAIGDALKRALGVGLPPAYLDVLRGALQHVIHATDEMRGLQLEVERLTRYTGRLETTNSTLVEQHAKLSAYAEQLVRELAPGLDVVVTAFNRAAQLKSAAAPSRLPLDITRRGHVSEETVAAVREAPGMAHQGD